MTTFAGALTALVTPFRDGQVDEPALRELVERQVSAGIHGLVPCGTTGESVNLSDAEYARVVGAVADQAKGRVPVLAGAGTASTHHTIALGQAAKAAGADGILTVVPYYNRPTQDGLVAHFEAVADGVGLPTVLYDIPKRTGSSLSMAALTRLADNPRFVALKDATGDLAHAGAVIATFGDRFGVLSGDDGLTLPIMACGGTGVISVTSNVAPSEVVKLVEAMRSGDLPTARTHWRRLAPLEAALFIESNPTPTKFALSLLGYMSDDVRLPLVRPTEPSQATIRNALSGLELL